jgi:predicted TIM-barrel fold metal-dependent hydrolase
LRRLSTDAADYIGRAVSGSAIVRALLRHVAQYPASWVQARIFPFVEKELDSGVLWGKKK